MMTTNKLWLLALCATLVSTAALVVPGAAVAAQTCEGDCNGDRAVAVDEIILGVRIALGEAPLGDCQAMDGNGDGAVTVNELTAADQCQTGVSCFPCAHDCSGNTRRCSLADTFATCEDGVF